MAKVLKFNQEVLKSILKGVKTLAQAVKVTLGPKGRSILIDEGFDKIISTKDGVRVAKEVILKDKFENMGAQLVKEAALKTSELVGDGTTTAVILAEAMYVEGFKNIIAGSNPMNIKKGMDYAIIQICHALDHLATPVTEIEKIKQIATISANNDPMIGSLIAEAIEKVGKDGTVHILEGKGIETTLDVTEGVQFDQGFLSPYFITNPEKMTTELDNALMLITDQKIHSLKDLIKLLEKVMERGARPFLIIAEDIEGEALKALLVNKIKGGFPICAIKTPRFGEYQRAFLEDLAILVGATLISEDRGIPIDQIELSMLGQCKRIKVTKNSTTIIGGVGDAKAIQDRINVIRSEIHRVKHEMNTDELKQRIAKLTGGVGIIQVGAATETELREKKSRFEDALDATRAALSEGIIPGGGVALLRALTFLDPISLPGDEQIGLEIVRKACFVPLTVIAQNCGKQGDLVAQKVFERQGSWGYNGLTDEFSDLFKDGIIDPVLVTKTAFRNAASISGLLLTVTTMVADKPKPRKKSSHSLPEDNRLEDGMGFK